MCGYGVWGGQPGGASSFQHTLAEVEYRPYSTTRTKNGTSSEVPFFMVCRAGGGRKDVCRLSFRLLRRDQPHDFPGGIADFIARNSLS